MKLKTAIAYIRVSRVGGRSGDSFLSPEIQAEAIKRLADTLGFSIVETIEELDASGGDADRKGWNRALKVIETGTAEAILVYNLSRFSRKQVDAIAAIDRIHAAGGSLISCQEGSFTNDSAGTLLRDTLLRFAQFERDRAKENFALVTANAIARGIPVASQIPFGYRRDPATRKYVVEPTEAAVIKTLFEMRAAGESWTDCARYLIANGGSEKTDRQAVKWIISNVTYLGTVRSGENFKKHAHEAIVSQRLFDTANAVKGKKPQHNGKLSSQTLLKGLVYCDNCGHKLGVGNTRGNANYTCHQVACNAHASITAAELDPEVINRLMQSWASFEFAAMSIEHYTGNAPEVEADLAEARANLADSEYILAKFDANKRDYLRAMEPAEYAEELRSYKADVEEARIAVTMAEAETIEPSKRENVAELWDAWTDESRREYLARVITRVIVKSAGGRRVPATERIAVETADGLYLHSKAQWSSEPWAEPQSALRIMSRTKAKRKARVAA